MATIKIKTFDSEKDAKDYFALIVEASADHGAYITQSGRVVLNDDPTPVVAEKKWIVIISGPAKIIGD